jgi:addiction module RelB/DinJ family antitoxin
MSLVPKTATIQLRVVPIVKTTSEKVLWRIGLTMSQAVELFLRRVIVDERLPFEVTALQTFQISGFTGPRPEGDPLIGNTDRREVGKRYESGKKRDRPGKDLKKFFGARTSSQISTKSKAKEGRDS